MKRSLLIASLTVFVASLASAPANAQIFRRACPGGTCPNAASVRVYAPYSYAQAVAPCEAIQAVQPCEPIAETVEAPEPCEPVATTIEPCAPVSAACEREEYFPTEQGNVCVNGTCPIRTVAKTVVKATAKTAKGVARTAAKTASWLAAVNRTRAAYGLAALRGDAALNAGCAEATSHCATVGGLDHTGENEILAYNQSGIEVAIQSWLQSSGHRAYLLSPNFTRAGISVVRDRHGRVWCAMRFR